MSRKLLQAVAFLDRRLAESENSRIGFLSERLDGRERMGLRRHPRVSNSRSAIRNGVDLIDITFDFRSDTPGYGLPRVDPDASSPTLRRYHQFLWSKPLPSGAPFELDVITPGVYLHHRSALGEFRLSSDAVVPTLRKKLKHLEIDEEELEEFNRVGYTIGGMMIWPSNKVDGAMTINGARGLDRRIADRFDLTLECIRRYYLGEPGPPGPLTRALARYPEFFGLFGDFAGFVDFFLLQDLVDEATNAVRLFTPFEDFNGSPLPGTADAYREYRERAIEFIESRNRRIAAHDRARRPK